jgi:hypothetical protein
MIASVVAAKSRNKRMTRWFVATVPVAVYGRVLAFAVVIAACMVFVSLLVLRVFEAWPL